MIITRAQLFAAIIIIGGLAMTAAQPALAAKERLMTLTGIGEVKMAPDMATITTGVVSDGSSAREALDKNNAAMARILAELRASGIADKDLQTSGFQVNPVYGRPKEGRPPLVRGYQVSNSLRVTVRELDKLGAVLDKVVTLGSNRIGGISFGLSDPKAAEAQARKRAMADAIAKAKLYAEAAGIKLGKIVTIRETVRGDSPRPVYARAAMESAPKVPIAAGQTSVRISVHVDWALD